MLGFNLACETLLRTYLKTFPCVTLPGVRQCSKTPLLEALSASGQRSYLKLRTDFMAISRDPDAFFRLNA